MYFPIASRVVAACVGLFLGSSAFAETPEYCTPTPISPVSCLNVKSMIPGLSAPSDRLDPRADRPTAIREDTSRARLRERQPLAPVIPNPGNVKRPRTSPAASAARGKDGAAASAVAGTPAAGIKSRSSSTAPAATSLPHPSAPPINQAAQERRKERAKARADRKSTRLNSSH